MLAGRLAVAVGRRYAMANVLLALYEDPPDGHLRCSARGAHSYSNGGSGGDGPATR
jgi:hypothetical protein